MFSVYLVTFACVVTSVILSVTASPITDALRRRLERTNKKLEKINMENVNLAKEIAIVENEIEKRHKDYETEKKELTDKNEKVLLEIEKLAFEMKHLQVVVEEKNKTANYLKDLKERIAFSILLSEEDVKVVKNRRDNGEEETCLRFEAEDSKKKYCKESTLSVRSAADDDTADIVLITGQIKLAESRVYAAEMENEQLEFTLKQKNDLLAFEKGKWRAEIDNKEKTLEINEEKVEFLKTEINKLKEIVASLDATITTLIGTINNEIPVWERYQNQLNTTYKIALACYKSNVLNTQTEIDNYYKFLRHGKSPKCT